MGDIFAFDSRFMKSNTPLFLKPGKITKEYNSGKRVRFVLPFRHYLIISIIFFICLVNFAGFKFNIKNENIGLQTQLNTQLGGGDKENYVHVFVKYAPQESTQCQNACVSDL